MKRIFAIALLVSASLICAMDSNEKETRITLGSITSRYDGKHVSCMFIKGEHNKIKQDETKTFNSPLLALKMMQEKTETELEFGLHSKSIRCDFRLLQLKIELKNNGVETRALIASEFADNVDGAVSLTLEEGKNYLLNLIIQPDKELKIESELVKQDD